MTRKAVLLVCMTLGLHETNVGVGGELFRCINDRHDTVRGWVVGLA